MADKERINMTVLVIFYVPRRERDCNIIFDPRLSQTYKSLPGTWTGSHVLKLIVYLNIFKNVEI